MFQEREVFALLLSIGVLVFAVRQGDSLRQIPHWRTLLTSLAMMLASLACSVIEGVVWEPFFNFIQHFCGALSAVLLAVWCWKTFSSSEVAV